jgi:hypothetical protein
LTSIGATGCCIPIGNKVILLAAVYRYPIKDWCDTDINELISIGNKAVLAGDLNTKRPVWNSQISNRSGRRLLKLQDDFQTTASRYPTHYTPYGNGDVLDIVVHKHVRISDVNVLEILDTDTLAVLFHMLDLISTSGISASVEIHTDWERF